MPRPALHAAALLRAFALPGSAAPPAGTKVEPPSWWPGHSIDPVRLLVRGRNLAEAEVTSAGPGLKTGPVTVNARGTHLFVDVAIDPKAAPGSRTPRARQRRI